MHVRVRRIVTLAAVAVLGVAFYHVGAGNLRRDPPPGAATRSLDGVTSHGQPFALADLRGQPVVLVFYRAGSCGLCLRRLRALADATAGYGQLGASVVAVTTDPPSASAQTRDGLALPFPLITVPRSELEAWGIWPADIEAPFPAEVVLGTSGEEVFRHVGRNTADVVGDMALFGIVRDYLAGRPAAER